MTVCLSTKAGVRLCSNLLMPPASRCRSAIIRWVSARAKLSAFTLVAATRLVSRTVRRASGVVGKGWVDARYRAHWEDRAWQDDLVELPRRRRPGPGAGGHRRRGLRAPGSLARPDVQRCRQPQVEGTGEMKLRRLGKEALR